MPDIVDATVRLRANTAGFQKQTQQAFGGLRKQLKETKASFQALAIGAGVFAGGMALIGKSAIDAAVQMERMKMGLNAVSASSEEAERTFEQLREVAKLPGLGLPEAVEGATRLIAVSKNADFATRALSAFGNALATIGKGRNELRLVVEQLTQMSAKSQILMEDLRPIMAQVPQMADAMRNAFGTAQVEQIREMGITAQEFISGVITELEKLPSAGNTAANAIENFSDEVFRAKAALGEALLPAFTSILAKLSDVVSKFNELSQTQKSIIAWSGAIAGGLAGVTAAITSLGLALPYVTAGVKALSVAFAWLAANPIVAVIAAAGALGIAALAVKKHFDDAKMTSDKFAESMEDLAKQTEKAQRIKNLTNSISDLREKTDLSSDEFQELIDKQNELAELAPQLVSGFDEEGNAITRAKDEAIKYNKELQNQIELLRELNILRAKQRLPELEKQIEEQRRNIEKWTEELRRTAPGEQVVTESFLGRLLGFMPGERKFFGKMTIEYETFVNVLRKKVEELRDTMREYQNLRKDILRAERGPVFGPPAPEPEKEVKGLPGAMPEDLEKTWEVARMHGKVLQVQHDQAREAHRKYLDDLKEREEAETDRLVTSLLAIQERKDAEDAARRKIRDDFVATQREMKQLEEDFANHYEETQRKLEKSSLDVARARIALIQDEATKAKGFAWITYKEKELALQAELSSVETTTERKKQIETELELLKEGLLKEYDEIDEEYKKKETERAKEAADKRVKAYKDSKKRIKKLQDKQQKIESKAYKTRWDKYSTFSKDVIEAQDEEVEAFRQAINGKYKAIKDWADKSEFMIRTVGYAFGELEIGIGDVTTSISTLTDAFISLEKAIKGSEMAMSDYLAVGKAWQDIWSNVGAELEKGKQEKEIIGDITEEYKKLLKKYEDNEEALKRIRRIYAQIMTYTAGGYVRPKKEDIEWWNRMLERRLPGKGKEIRRSERPIGRILRGGGITAEEAIRSKRGQIGPGVQISAITGPTRDLLVDLLMPLRNLNVIPSLMQAMTHAIYEMRDAFLGKEIATLNGNLSKMPTVATQGGGNVAIENVNINVEKAADAGDLDELNRNISRAVRREKRLLGR